MPLSHQYQLSVGFLLGPFVLKNTAQKGFFDSLATNLTTFRSITSLWRGFRLMYQMKKFEAYVARLGDVKIFYRNTRREMLAFQSAKVIYPKEALFTRKALPMPEKDRAPLTKPIIRIGMRFRLFVIRPELIRLSL